MMDDGISSVGLVRVMSGELGTEILLMLSRVKEHMDMQEESKGR